MLTYSTKLDMGSALFHMLSALGFAGSPTMQWFGTKAIKEASVVYNNLNETNSNQNRDTLFNVASH